MCSVLVVVSGKGCDSFRGQREVGGCEVGEHGISFLFLFFFSFLSFNIRGNKWKNYPINKL